MHVQRALTFLFQDRHWVRTLGIAMLLNVLPVVLMTLHFPSTSSAAPREWQAVVSSPLWSLLVVGAAGIPLSGFELRITRQVIGGTDLPLPAWSDVRGILRDGLMLWAVLAPWTLLSTIVDQITRRLDQTAAVGLAAQLASLLIVVLTSLAILAAQGRLAASASLAAGLDLIAILRTLLGNLGAYLRLALVLVVLGGIAVAVGVGAVLLVERALIPARGLSALLASVEHGIAVTALLFGAYGRMVVAHLIGQVYARTTQT